jgi:membrane fusion protein
MEKLPANVPLFRREVVEFKNDNVFGGVLIRQPRELGWLLAVCVAFIAALLILVFFVDFTQRSRVAGWLQTFPGPAKVAAPRAGVVGRVHVQDGQRVEAGQVLVTLVTGRDLPGGGSVEGAVVERMREVGRDLSGRMDSRKALLQHEDASLRAELRSLEADAAATAELRQLAQERLAVAEAELARMRQLAEQGLVAKSAVGAALETALRTKQEAKQVEQRLAEQRRTLAKSRAALASLKLQSSIELSEMSSQLSTVEQNIINTAGEGHVTIVAAVAGRVTAVTATVGDSVAAGQPLLAVTPTDAKLQAHLLVPTKAAAFLKDGAVIRLQYDAFPYQKFGQYDAVVTAISGTVIAPEDQHGVVRSREAVFSVVADLQQVDVSAYGKSYELRPGLTLTAELSGDRQTMFQKIVEPLYTATVGDRL